MPCRLLALMSSSCSSSKRFSVTFAIAELSCDTLVPHGAPCGALVRRLPLRDLRAATYSCLKQCILSIGRGKKTSHFEREKTLLEGGSQQGPPEGTQKAETCPLAQYNPFCSRNRTGENRPGEPRPLESTLFGESLEGYKQGKSTLVEAFVGALAGPLGGPSTFRRVRLLYARAPSQQRKKYTPPPWKTSFFAFSGSEASMVDTLLSGAYGENPFFLIFPRKWYTA